MVHGSRYWVSWPAPFSFSVTSASSPFHDLGTWSVFEPAAVDATKMKPSLRKLALACLSLYPVLCAADDCPPWTWTWDNVGETAATDAPKPFQRAKITPYAHKNDSPQPGDINCRSYGRMYDSAGSWSCNQLAQTYSITIEKFWKLNPELAPDCEGIRPNTEYCVDGCKWARPRACQARVSLETTNPPLRQQSSSRSEPTTAFAAPVITTPPASARISASAAMPRRGRVARQCALFSPSPRVHAEVDG